MKSTMMNVSMDSAPIIPHVLIWLQTMSASVLWALLVSYLCHHFHSLGLRKKKKKKVQFNDYKAMITIKADW